MVFHIRESGTYEASGKNPWTLSYIDTKCRYHVDASSVYDLGFGKHLYLFGDRAQAYLGYS